MDLKLQITEEDLNKEISKSILDAGVGKYLKEDLSKVVQNYLTGYSSPVQKTVCEVVKKAVEKEILKEENQKIIATAVTKHFSSEIIEKIITHGIKKLKEYYEDCYR